MEQIYTYARIMITSVMAELRANNGYSEKETSFVVKDVKKEGPIIIEVHQKIKLLIETVIHTKTAIEGIINFENKTDDIVRAIVFAQGADSYFFARMLHTALIKLNTGTVDIISINCNLIQSYARLAILRKMRSEIFSTSINAYYNRKEKTYNVKVPINGSFLTFTGQNTDKLCLFIGKQVRNCE